MCVCVCVHACMHAHVHVPVSEYERVCVNAFARHFMLDGISLVSLSIITNTHQPLLPFTS